MLIQRLHEVSETYCVIDGCSRWAPFENYTGMLPEDDDCEAYFAVDCVCWRHADWRHIRRTARWHITGRLRRLLRR